MAERRVAEDRDPLVDIAVERSTLGCALLGQAADLADDKLEESVFYRGAHQLIWRACLAVLEAGGDPNPLTVSAWLRANGELERVREVYLFELTDGHPKQSAANLVWLVGRLVELATGREIREAQTTFSKALATNPDVLSDGTLDEHIEALDSARAKREQTAPWLDVAGQWQALKHEAKRTSEGAVSTGISELDALIDGVRPGEVLGLMGRPGLGKTVLLCNQARWMAHAHWAHVFVSLEMPAAQIVTRLVQAEYELSRPQVLGYLRAGQLDDQTYAERFEGLRIIDRGGLSVSDIGQRVRRLQERDFKGRAIKAITLDHLGLVGGDRKLATYDRISLQVREIKELAKALNLAVVLAIQVNREAGGDGSKELHLGSARDSGVVEEAMDYLIGLRRFDRSESLSQAERDRYKDVLFLKVIKSRHGAPGEEVSVQFDWTLDVKPIAMAVPESASKVAHFGGSRR